MQTLNMPAAKRKVGTGHRLGFQKEVCQQGGDRKTSLKSDFRVFLDKYCFHSKENSENSFVLH